MTSEPDPSLRPDRYVEPVSAEQRRWYAHTLIERRLIDAGVPHEEAHRQTLLRQGVPLDDYAPVRLRERAWIAREWFRFTERQRLFAGVRPPLPSPPFPTPPAATSPVFCLRCGQPLRGAESAGRPIWVCDAGRMEYSIFATAELNRLLARTRPLAAPLVRPRGTAAWYCPRCGIPLLPPPLAREPCWCERCGFELTTILKEDLIELNWHEP
ncbi:MAG: hypothetical protein NZ773_00765 [Dehalococcoidia bacterium]|nr:hypothetical protein [Dehalococcoidia bacterium]